MKKFIRRRITRPTRLARPSMMKSMSAMASAPGKLGPAQILILRAEVQAVSFRVNALSSRLLRQAGNLDREYTGLRAWALWLPVYTDWQIVEIRIVSSLL